MLFLPLYIILYAREYMSECMYMCLFEWFMHGWLWTRQVIHNDNIIKYDSVNWSITSMLSKETSTISCQDLKLFYKFRFVRDFVVYSHKDKKLKIWLKINIWKADVSRKTDYNYCQIVTTQSFPFWFDTGLDLTIFC